MKSATASRLRLGQGNRAYEGEILTNLDVNTMGDFRRDDSPENTFMSVKQIMEQHAYAKGLEENLSVYTND